MCDTLYSKCLQAALLLAVEGCEEMERVFRKDARAVDDLKEVCESLNRAC
jgi:hypothetical protein